MKFINEQNEKLLLELEYDRTNLRNACEILENQLFNSFKVLIWVCCQGKCLMVN